MNPEQLAWLKAIAIWSFIIAAGLVTACIGFISVVSVWTGFTHMHESGFWVPILGGTVIFIVALWVYLRAARTVYGHLKSQDLFDL